MLPLRLLGAVPSLVGIALVSHSCKPGKTGSAETASAPIAADARAPESPQTPSAPPPSAAAPDVLEGSWLREDGGYVLRLGKPDPGGRIHAAYFNPAPIHVERAAVTHADGRMKITVVLRDTNYPGCAYDLVHDAASDTLRGTYFQAASGSLFPVAFQRQR